MAFNRNPRVDRDTAESVDISFYVAGDEPPMALRQLMRSLVDNVMLNVERVYHNVVLTKTHDEAEARWAEEQIRSHGYTPNKAQSSQTGAYFLSFVYA